MPQSVSRSISTKRECGLFIGSHSGWRIFEAGQRGILEKLKVGWSIDFSRTCIPYSGGSWWISHIAIEERYKLQKSRGSFRGRQEGRFLVFAKITIKRDSLPRVRLGRFIAQPKTSSFPFALSSDPRTGKRWYVNTSHGTAGLPKVQISQQRALLQHLRLNWLNGRGKSLGSSLGAI